MSVKLTPKNKHYIPHTGSFGTLPKVYYDDYQVDYQEVGYYPIQLGFKHDGKSDLMIPRVEVTNHQTGLGNFKNKPIKAVANLTEVNVFIEITTADVK